MSQSFIRTPFEDIDRQREAVSFGMWVFLVSEMLLFAGLFAGYAIYRGIYANDFLAGARHCDIVFGTINTALLMSSSLTFAIASRAAKADFGKVALRLLLATLLLGLIFLVVKGFEYSEDISRHLLPGTDFALRGKGAQIFFSFYWLMTSVHALHVTGGLIAILRLIVNGKQNPAWLKGSSSVEATALFWHLVDVIWVILYPLLYLSGRAHG
jgi:cytochrome c oxidase subunit 3